MSIHGVTPLVAVRSSGAASAPGVSVGRGIITIPQQQLAGSSRDSQELAQLHNAAERSDVVALEVAESSAPHRALSGALARFLPKPDQERVRGGLVSVVTAGPAGGLLGIGA
jgi:hypothetical protein